MFKYILVKMFDLPNKLYDTYIFKILIFWKVEVFKHT